MRALSKISGLVVVSVLVVGDVAAQTSFSQTVSIVIPPTSVIAVSGDPLPLLADRTSMDGPASVMDASTFYNLTTNVSNVIIEAELDVEMPQGTELWLTAESRLGHSEGAIRLQGSGQSHRLVSAIARGLENGRGLTYEFVVREDVRSLLLQTRRVTLALIDAETGRRQEVVQTVVFGVSTSAEAGRSYVSGVD